MAASDTNTDPVLVDLGNGAMIRVEATSLGGREKVGSFDKLPFTEVTAAIESVARLLSDSLRRIKPRKASVEFGVELAIEGGKLVALVCQGSLKANLKIALEWSGADETSA